LRETHVGQSFADIGKGRRVELRTRGRLSGGLDALRLEPVEVIDGALRVGGGGEDRAVVVLQDLQPRGDVGGVIVPDLRGEFEIGAQEC
jgi:hypothetical protein